MVSAPNPSPGLDAALTGSFTVRQSPALPRGFALDGAPLDGRLYVQPAGFVSGEAAASAIISSNGWAVAGGALAFTACTVLLRERDAPEGHVVTATTAPFHEVLNWSMMQGEAVASHVSTLLHRIGAKRAPFAGLSMDRPVVMGIVNVTPDSFSDGGDHADTERAVAAALAMAEAGAGIIDVGGESTRPGSAAVSPEEECARVLPVIRALAERGLTVSVDSRHALVMEQSLAAGAKILNDISALEGEPASLAVAARSGAPVILMHMQGEPGTMQNEPHYDCAPLDVYDYLAARREACLKAGIAADNLCLDPGIGFGKTVDHNLEVLARLGLYHALGCPLLLGVSRKTFIGRLSRNEPPRQRLAGSLAVGLAGLDQGVQILRVHDVAETVQAVALWQAMKAAG